LPCVHLALPLHAKHQLRCKPCSQMLPPLQTLHRLFLMLWLQTLCREALPTDSLVWQLLLVVACLNG
jgi:hypothetical protein